MSVDRELERAEWIREHLNRAPHLIVHIRRLRVPSLAMAQGPRVSGGSDPARAPLQLDPLDDADELWAAMCLVALQLEQRIQDRAPVEFERQRTTIREGGGKFVQGFATTDETLIYRSALELAGWLHAHSVTLALNDTYQDAVEYFVQKVTEFRRKYPEAPMPFRHKMRCPRCGRRELVKVYSLSGEIEALECKTPDGCGAKRVF